MNVRRSKQITHNTHDDSNVKGYRSASTRKIAVRYHCRQKEKHASPSHSHQQRLHVSEPAKEDSITSIGNPNHTSSKRETQHHPGKRRYEDSTSSPFKSALVPTFDTFPAVRTEVHEGYATSILCPLILHNETYIRRDGPYWPFAPLLLCGGHGCNSVSIPKSEKQVRRCSFYYPMHLYSVVKRYIRYPLCYSLTHSPMPSMPSRLSHRRTKNRGALFS